MIRPLGLQSSRDDLADRHGAWRQLLETARYAPSPHNVQPWRIRLSGDGSAEVFIDGTRTLPNEDHTGSFLLSAMGMFLEAIELVAAQRGIRVEAEIARDAEWFADRIADRNERGLTSFATLRMFGSVVADGRGYPIELFRARRTSRISLRPNPVPEAIVQSLAQMADKWGHRYTHLTDAATIDEILNRNIDAVFYDMNVAAYHDEITEWFRFTDRAARWHRDGLDWRCMNVSRSEFWLSARMSKTLRFGPTRWILKHRYRQLLGTVPAIGVLSGDFFEAKNAVYSGRFLLRFWLELARDGLYLHPYGNMVTNPEAATWMERKTGVAKAWLVFKVGYCDPPPASYRRSVEEILVPES